MTTLKNTNFWITLNKNLVGNVELKRNTKLSFSLEVQFKVECEKDLHSEDVVELWRHTEGELKSILLKTNK